MKQQRARKVSRSFGGLVCQCLLCCACLNVCIGIPSPRTNSASLNLAEATSPQSRLQQRSQRTPPALLLHIPNHRFKTEPQIQPDCRNTRCGRGEIRALVAPFAQSLANRRQQRFAQASPLELRRHGHPMHPPPASAFEIIVEPCRACANDFPGRREEETLPFAQCLERGL